MRQESARRRIIATIATIAANAACSFAAWRDGFRNARHRVGFLAFMLLGIAAVTHADNPGLDSRVTIGAYMNNYLPATTADPMPATLSLTGVFTDLAARTPHAGFVPYDLNAPLWTDGAEKSRFIAVPYDSANPSDQDASPRIGFAPDGNWSFPNGTVIIKNFDMKMDEQPGAANAMRRLETRILVRSADGSLRGASYRWRQPVAGAYSDADIVHLLDNETLTITQANGAIRNQNYTYPGEADCLRCHNANAGMVLGIRTAQLNGNFTYPGTGRTDNQLNTWYQLGMLNTSITDPSSYPKAANISDSTATMEHRIRSYLASNCAHCHQPGSEGPIYDMRFETPTLDTNIIGPFGGLIRDDLQNSRLFVRDSAPPDVSPMPPVARNVPDPLLVGVNGLYSAWVNSTYDVITATRLNPTQVRLQFSRPLEPASKLATGNYALDNGATVNQVTADADPAVVILTTSPLALSTTYTVTINAVKEQQAPQNPIWPNTTIEFLTPGPVAPDAPVLTGIQTGNGEATLSFTPPGYDGGAAITGYDAECTSAGPSTVTTSGTASPITVTGLSNGVPYICVARAVNSQGAGAASNSLNVTPFAPVPKLLGVFSRKTHGSAGTYDLPLNRQADVNGAVTVESRAESTHKIVFRFDIPLNTPGTASSTTGAVSADLINDEVTLTISGAPDNHRATLTLTNVNGAGVDVSISVGFLIGDVNSSQDVSLLDVATIKSHAGRAVDQSNFQMDLNLSGSITAADMNAVKARVPRTLSLLMM